MDDVPMLWREIIAASVAYLDGKGVAGAQTAAELLAARLLKCPRGLLAGALDQPVPEPFREAMRRALRRLCTGEPLQYVLGEWDFRTLTLTCDRRALIPRPETEELVTRVLTYLRSRTFEPGDRPLIIDVGTGTGAIILSLAEEFRADASFLGTDVSEAAIALAKENARRCRLEPRVSFICMDGLDDFDEPGVVDVLVSNPPYVPSAVCETLDTCVKDFEPRLALDGGAGGLDFYDRYLADALNVLKPGGKVFFEIGDGQGARVGQLMADYGFSDILIEKDFAGHDRYASALLPA
jgi:release factor glutamine methyltransferase